MSARCPFSRPTSLPLALPLVERGEVVLRGGGKLGGGEGHLGPDAALAKGLAQNRVELHQRAEPAQAPAPEPARAGQVLLVDAGLQQRLEGVGLRGHVGRLGLVEHQRQEGGLEVGQLHGAHRDPVHPRLARDPDPGSAAQDLELVLLALAAGRDQRPLGQAEVLDDPHQGRGRGRGREVVGKPVLLSLQVA